MRNFFLTALASLMLFSCIGTSPVQTFDRIVHIGEVQPLGYVNKSFAAVVESAEQTSLAFQMGGEIIELNVMAGDVVRKGEVVAKVDPTDSRLQMEAAKALYITAKSEKERYQRLLAKDVISKQQYEAASATYVSRKSAYENTLQMLENTEIFAPFTGIVEQKFAEAFQRVQPAQQVVKIINPDSLEVVFTISPTDSKLMDAPKVQYYVEFDNYPGVKFKAILKRYIDVSIGGEGFPMVVAISDPNFSLKKYNIKAGYTCSVLMAVENTQNDILAVPISAIYADKQAKESQVWVYNPTTSTVNLTTITTGELFGSDMIAVTHGLKIGDRVVTAGIYQLTKGEKVKVLKSPKY